LPNDLELIGNMAADISYFNARRYFGFFPDKEIPVPRIPTANERGQGSDSAHVPSLC